VILVGGVAELLQGDLDLGRLAVERLAGEDLGEDVHVEELSWGAVTVSHRLVDLRPDALVLVAAHPRGRAPGAVERREAEPRDRSIEHLQLAVGDAVTGYVDVDLLVDVCAALGTLPPRVVAIEVEPAATEPGEGLSDLARSGLEEAVRLVRAEVAALRA
jgi:hypothetical protein